MAYIDDKIKQKISKLYCCEKCDYVTSRKCNYNTHLLSTKHIKIDKDLQNSAIKQNLSNFYFCECGKEYKHRQSLWKHKKDCNTTTHNIESNNSKVLNMENFMEVMKQNSDFKDLILEQNKIIMELAKNSTYNMTNCNNNNNINSHNKTFNLQVFLNEKCKDALNIDEFVDSLKISLADIENLGENGFVSGVSRIFVNGLKNLDIYKRPIHCSDLKRETMHIKEHNIWEKDNDNKDKLRKAVKMVSHKNMLKINDWKKVHPQYNDLDSKKNDQYLKILIGTAGPYNSEEADNCFNKIIRNIAKEVTINKEIL